MQNSISIVRATGEDVLPCLEILLDSYLGEEYFSREVAEPILDDSRAKNELFVAKDEAGNVLGFYHLAMDGTFLAFPYLHLIAVKKNLRGSGVGTKLLEDVEKRVAGEIAYPFFGKVFLLCGKKNEKAKTYYEKNGYITVGSIPALFAEGEDECLMMKDVTK